MKPEKDGSIVGAFLYVTVFALFVPALLYSLGYSMDILLCPTHRSSEKRRLSPPDISCDTSGIQPVSEEQLHIQDGKTHEESAVDEIPHETQRQEIEVHTG